MRYAFIAEHRPVLSIRAMCRCLSVQPSGFYAWLKDPLSRRAREDERQTKLIRAAWRDSGKVYGYRKLHDDLADMGESCCPNRIARLSRRHPGADRLQVSSRPIWRQAVHCRRQQARSRVRCRGARQGLVTDITYIRTHEGFAYLAVVLDLFSRRVVGWSMQPLQTTNVVL